MTKPRHKKVQVEYTSAAYQAYVKSHGTFGAMTFRQFNQSYPSQSAMDAALKSVASKIESQFAQDVANLALWPGTASNIQNYPKESALGAPYGMSSERLDRLYGPVGPPLAFPGLTKDRRVVLDLCFNGYGLSSTIVSKTGELLAIQDPQAPRHDPVGGVHLARMPLGLAVQKLLAEGQRFDLIVAEVPHNWITPMVGFFPPPPPVLAKTGRRLLLPGSKPTLQPARTMNGFLAVWRATHALLSEHGEALLRSTTPMVGALPKGEPNTQRAWYLCGSDTELDIYLHTRSNTPTSSNRFRANPPTHSDRPFALNRPAFGWTSGQVNTFKTKLL